MLLVASGDKLALIADRNLSGELQVCKGNAPAIVPRLSFSRRSGHLPEFRLQYSSYFYLV
jgi:hypothetical protein